MMERTVKQLQGTPSQVEWAQLIRSRVSEEFDRTLTLFRTVAHRQSAGKRDDTEAIINILEEKR
ncbi:MAG: hypothetical protein H7039_24705, partial [Bryobacteraceae bacterium]|nr:hypothetical protein [Bryobacteraceae bacterium]